MSLVTAILLGACQPPIAADPSAEAPPAEPATPTSIPPTLIPAPPSATPMPSPTPTAEPALLPALDPERYFAYVEGCDVLPPGMGESLVGPLTQPAWTEQVYSDFDPRFVVACHYLGEDKSLGVQVWIAPTLDEAEADYRSALDFAGDEAVSVDGLGEAAFWWPRALRLDVLHKNARLWITFSRLLDDLPGSAPTQETADSAAILAAAALPLIDPALDAIDPPVVAVPAGAPVAEIVTIEQLWENGSFEACSLLEPDDFEALIGPTQGPPQSGMSIGEMVGTFYDCGASASDGAVSFSLYFADSPSSALNRFRESAAHADPPAEMLEDTGDRAVLWSDGYSYTISVLRGTVVAYFYVSMEDTPENQARAVEFARLVMERIYERAAQGVGR
jgi:hypothetical protein